MINLSKLEAFAVEARRELMRSVKDKIAYALQENSPIRRQNPQAVTDLEKAIKSEGEDAVVERTAYAWFNRFCALRFMDVNGYTDSGVVTPPMGGTIPGILAEARDGNFDEGLFASGIKERVRNILTGSTREDDPNSAAYRVLFIATCNSWQPKMPFLFERLGDWTEILLPDDLLSANSILAKVRSALTAESCADVSVIGWLYQFYISEKKSAIEEGFKSNIKASPENIPAVTQLFTPHWIVKYLVQNSLGRLWLALHPESALKSIMEYYVPGDPEHPTPVPTGIERPEDIRVCDPCCGSAHMLIYAFDILYFIYEESGYSPAEIPGLILKYNLYGLELDARAAALASFALVMKARSKYSRFLRNPTMPNICPLQAVKFDPGEIKAYMDRIGRDLFTVPFATTLEQFEEADNFGSLIVPALDTAADVEPIFQAKDLESDLLYRATHHKVLAILHQAAFLACRYHVVVTNPPYLGSSNMNPRLKVFAEDLYPNSKSDLFAMFIERCSKLCVEHGNIAMITMLGWMFIPSYEKLRLWMLHEKCLITMAHLGPRAFDSIGGEVVTTTAFVMANHPGNDVEGSYVRLVEGQNEVAKETALLEAIATGKDLFKAKASDFGKIPGSLISYWVSSRVFDLLSGPSLEGKIEGRIGLATGNNDLHLRLWFEVPFSHLGLGYDRTGAKGSGLKWFPHDKAGTFRRWYGNVEYVVNWKDDGNELQTTLHPDGHRIWAHNFNLDYIFKPHIGWSNITTGTVSFRKYEQGFLFDASANAAYTSADQFDYLLGLVNTCFVKNIAHVLNPTIHFNPGDFHKIPFVEVGDRQSVESNVRECVRIAKADWNSVETGLEYRQCSLLNVTASSCSEAYNQVRAGWLNECMSVHQCEEANNRIFLEAYGLQGEFRPDVQWHEVSLLCNPWYRYGKIAPVVEGQTGMPVDQELESRLKTDTVKDLVSYAVGCMMGRYSLEKPGLILADQGAGEADYYAKIGVDKAAAKFQIDDDGIIPILDNDWFEDDIVTRFKAFIKVAFGEEHFFENMAWIEEALGKDIRSYFTKDFYKDHLQRYQNRPIYWLFQSPKGAFRALVYMHRYKPDMVGGVLGYLRSLQTKVDNQLDVAMQVGADESKSASERVRANKDAVKYAKAKKELDEYEKNVLYPLSTERIEIDLDDGVKVNYKKFGVALRKVAALEGKGE